MNLSGKGVKAFQKLVDPNEAKKGMSNAHADLTFAFYYKGTF